MAARGYGDLSASIPRMTTSTDTWRDHVVALIPALRAFAWSISRNGSDADDLVQDTLIKAWSHRDKFEPGTNLRAWLFTILRNTYYTAVVRRRREVRDEDGQLRRALTPPPAQDWGLAIRALQDALDALPLEHREALILVGGAGSPTRRRPTSAVVRWAPSRAGSTAPVPGC